jgi:peptidoglycan hydrolase-like protein with peptidoglycan-binding domain
MRRPVDAFAIAAAAAVSLVIVVNAILMQSGAHSAPFFANSKPVQTVANDAAKPAATPIPVRSIAGTPNPQPVAVRRNDPIADLIAPSPRIVVVQHALSEYGYGQVKPSGVLDEPTSSAIEKFEREHKLPVTGRISDRLVGELTTLVGHPLE